MNGIERITQRIAAEAQTEIEKIEAAARDESARILERYRQQAERERAELAVKNEKAAAEREERLVSVAQMEARKVTLAARQEMVETVYARALEKLCALPQDEYQAALVQLLVQAAPSGRGEVIFSEKDRKAVGTAVVEQANEKLQGSLSLSDETRPICGGFMLRDGNVEVNCMFDTLVRLQKAETAGAVAKMLFS